MNKFVLAVLHVVLFALVAAIGAYWAVRIMTPSPIAAPPPLAAPPPREPDPVAAARLFGLVQVAVATVSNIQVAGVFAAGADSSAILMVDGKPPRAFVLGQEVVSGARLVGVQSDSVVLGRAGGARQELRAPQMVPAHSGTTLPAGMTPAAAATAAPPAFKVEGDTLSATESNSFGFGRPPPPPNPIYPQQTQSGFDGPRAARLGPQ